MLRLITFSRLCLLREPSEDNSATTAAVAELSCLATTFDCHLLQRSPGSKPLDVLIDEARLADLRQSLKDVRGDVAVVSSLESTAVEFPEWMPVTRRTHSDVAALTEAIGRTATDVEWLWTHVELPDGSDADHWLATVLNASARLVTDFPDDGLIVTSVAGEPPMDGRFESLLWEGCIRVPLWLALPGQFCRQVTQPTGSFDVFETVLAAGETAAASAAVDLRRMIDGLAERSIRLRHGQTAAVRTPNFLCVRVVDEFSEQQTAVYGKPHDVWNVHDLSHEYPDVADQAFADTADGDALM